MPDHRTAPRGAPRTTSRNVGPRCEARHRQFLRLNTHRRTTRNPAPKCKKPNRDGWAKCKKLKTNLVGGARFELATNGLKVRCSTG